MRASVTLTVGRYVLLAISVVTAMALASSANDPPWTVPGYFVSLGVVVAAISLLQTRRVLAAGWILVALAFVCATLVTWSAGGLTAHNAIAYVMTILMAGACAGRNAAILVAIASVVACTLLMLAEMRGLLPRASQPLTPAGSWIAITVALLLTGLFANLIVRSLDRSLARTNEVLDALSSGQKEAEARAHFGAELARLAEEAISATDVRHFFDRAAAAIRANTGAERVLFGELDSEGTLTVLFGHGWRLPPAELHLPDALREALRSSGRSHGSGSELGSVLTDLQLAPTASVRWLALQSRKHVRHVLVAVFTERREISAVHDHFFLMTGGMLSAQLEREWAEDRAQRAEKLELVGRVVGGVAHDFNNLLVAVMSVGSDLKERHGEDPIDRTLVRDLDTACDRAVLLTRQLLAFSRQRDSQAATHDLVMLVKNFVPMLRRLLGRGVTIRQSLDTTPVPVAADPMSVEQVLLNLAVNGRDAMPHGGWLTLSVERANGCARMSVRDTGVGIDDAVRKRMFVPFFSTKAEGTGLGLATVAELVERLHGKIAVQSALGEGSTFVVELPLADVAELPPEPKRAPVSRGRGRLLVVEDDDLVRVATSRMLKSAGYSVEARESGVAALELLARDSDFRAIVTDVSMPEMSGIELAQSLRAMGLEHPVLFVSGHIGGVGGGVPPPELGRFLPKPFTMAALVAALEEMLAERPIV